MSQNAAKNMSVVANKYNIIQPPVNLIDCSVFPLDFSERKFILLGLDPTNKFDVAVRIVTSTRYIDITVDLLRRILSMMGYILSIISDRPVKSRERLFLKDETITLSKTAYRGDNYLALDSHRQSGSRLLLSRKNLLALQGTEACINEAITRKSIVTRSIVVNQMERIAEYLKTEFFVLKNSSLPQIESALAGIHPDLIIMHTPVAAMEPRFIIQILQFAHTQLTLRWMEKLSEPVATESKVAAADDDVLAAFDVNDGPTYFDYLHY